MKNNLSSQIVLSRVPSKLYRTTDSLELSRLTRREKIQTTIVEVEQNGKVIDSKIDDGYIYFSAIPNGGDIVVRGAIADKLDQTTIDQSQMTNRKLIIDGQLIIIRGDKIYNAFGGRMK